MLHHPPSQNQPSALNLTVQHLPNQARAKLLASRLGRVRACTAGMKNPEIGEHLHPEVKDSLSRLVALRNQRVEKLKEESVTAHELCGLMKIYQADTFDNLKSAMAAVNASRHPGHIAYHEPSKHDIPYVRSLVNRLGIIKRELAQLNQNEEQEMLRKKNIEMQLAQTTKLGSFREWFSKNGKPSAHKQFKGYRSEFLNSSRRVPNWGIGNDGLPQQGTRLHEMIETAEYHGIVTPDTRYDPQTIRARTSNLSPSTSQSFRSGTAKTTGFSTSASSNHFPSPPKTTSRQHSASSSSSSGTSFLQAHPGYYPPQTLAMSGVKRMVTGRIYH
jgi:hypothetical protein